MNSALQAIKDRNAKARDGEPQEHPGFTGLPKGLKLSKLLPIITAMVLAPKPEHLAELWDMAAPAVRDLPLDSVEASGTALAQAFLEKFPADRELLLTFVDAFADVLDPQPSRPSLVSEGLQEPRE